MVTLVSPKRQVIYTEMGSKTNKMLLDTGAVLETGSDEKGYYVGLCGPGPSEKNCEPCLLHHACRHSVYKER